MSHPFRILLVDNNPLCLSALGRLLRRDGYDVQAAADAAEACRLAATTPPDVVISDMSPAGDGWRDLLVTLHARHPAIRGIALSGLSGADDKRRSLEAGYECLLTKPLNFDDVRDAIEASAPPHQTIAWSQPMFDHAAEQVWAA